MDKISKFVLDNNQYVFHKLDLNFWKDKSIRFPDNHPNKNGHEKIAEELFKYLKNNVFIDCK